MSNPRTDPTGYLAYLARSGRSAERASELRMAHMLSGEDGLPGLHCPAGIDFTQPWPDNRDPHRGTKWQRFFPKSPSLNESECDA